MLAAFARSPTGVRLVAIRSARCRSWSTSRRYWLRTRASTRRSRLATWTPCPTCGCTTTWCAPIRAGGRCTAGAPWPGPGSPLFGGPQHLQFILTDERVTSRASHIGDPRREPHRRAGRRDGGGGQHVPPHRRPLAHGAAPWLTRRAQPRPGSLRASASRRTCRARRRACRPSATLRARPSSARASRWSRTATFGRRHPGSPSAGVSVVSVFQHFDDLPSLHIAVTENIAERMAAWWPHRCRAHAR